MKKTYFFLVLLALLISRVAHSTEELSVGRTSSDHELSVEEKSVLVAGGLLAGTFTGVLAVIPTFYFMPSEVRASPFLYLALVVGEISAFSAIGATIAAAIFTKLPIPFIVAPTSFVCSSAGCVGLFYLINAAPYILEGIGIAREVDTNSFYYTVPIGIAVTMLSIMSAVAIETGLGITFLE